MRYISTFRGGFLLLLMACSILHARVFLTGSNPSLSVIAFPQDLFLMPGEMVYGFITYQKNPWWGDIDDPENRPGKEYLLSGDERTATNDNPSYQFNSAIHAVENRYGFSRQYSPSLKMRFDILHAAQYLRSSAEGSLRDNNSVSYTYKEHNSIQELYISSILATYLRNIPIGFKLGLGTVFTTEPDVDYNMSNGTSSEHLLWGWNGHGSYYDQNEYSIGSLFKFDAQFAATLPKLKWGGRFRLYNGTQDHYRWDNLLNQYELSPKKIRNVTGRLYGNYTWKEFDKFKFNTLVLSRYTFVDSMGLSSSNQNIETGVVEKAKTFVFQINPNVNIFPWEYKMTYVDAAILLNYQHMKYDYVEQRSVGGGRKEAHVGTNVYFGEDYSWENYSYGRENLIEAALDINAAIPVYGNKNQTVALGLTLLLWTHFKWMNKYYGKTNTSASDDWFTVENIRKNFDHETWLNSAFNIIYRRGEYLFRFDIGQPLIYSITPKTTITDASGKNVLYQKSKESMWVSQSGMKIGIFVSTSLENFKSYRIFDRAKNKR